jgi:toluene monooxygenase electron transfer component
MSEEISKSMFRVVLDQTDPAVSVEVNAADSLLSGLLRAGIAMPYECSAGGCGSCKFTLVEGELETLIEDPPGIRPAELRKGKRLACTCRPTGDCIISFKLDTLLHPEITPTRFSAILIDRIALNHDMSKLVFQSDHAPPFLPGQYAKLTLPDGSVTRNYSMDNICNDQGLWSFVIRRVPGGAATPELVDGDILGKEFMIDGPYSVAHLDKSTNRQVICIAGGSGLAPMVSVIRGLQDEPSRIRSARLFHGARSQADLIPQNYLSDIEGFDLSSQFTSVLSEPSERESWDGPTGFIHDHLNKILATDCSETDFYIAGPPVMVDAVRRVLILGRSVPVEQLRYDRFF